MAGMGAGVTGSYLGYLVQRVFLDEEGRKAKLQAAHGRAAATLYTAADRSWNRPVSA